jgi:hypothetical protein
MGGSQEFYDDGGAINGGWEKFSFTGLRGGGGKCSLASVVAVLDG